LSLAYGSDSSESDGDFGDHHHKHGDEEVNDGLALAPTPQPNHSLDNNDNNHSVCDNELSVLADCPLASATATKTVTHELNGQSLSPNLDENQLISRRKSNRISKPIQRSLESSTTANSPNVSLKKTIGLYMSDTLLTTEWSTSSRVLTLFPLIVSTVKQNLLQNNVTNCETEKAMVNRTAKPDDSNAKSSKGGKSLRKLQMWTNEDTKCFFEAICEVID
jgi:hypothetical protein